MYVQSGKLYADGFEWDANKAKSNLRKHGVRFEDAVLVFDDPRHPSRQERYENGEYVGRPWPCPWHCGHSGCS
ncbi:BrnT family toxin [Salmonella enterica subsp. enterica]|nr:BrnT family toxin [Salmonella enterica subsp. enterica]